MQLTRAHMTVKIMQGVKTSKTSSSGLFEIFAPSQYASGIRNTPPNKLMFPRLPLSNPVSRKANAFTVSTPQTVWRIAMGIAVYHAMFSRFRSRMSHTAVPINPMLSSTHKETSIIVTSILASWICSKSLPHSHHLCWNACGDCVVRNIFRHDCTCRDNATGANMNPRQN